MTSNVKRFFLLFALVSFCLKTHARDSKFFSKISNENKESISIAPIQPPTLAPSPSPEPDVVEHGYGLYGQETNQNYQYPPTTTNPTKSEKSGEEKFVNSEELSKNNFKEFGMGYSNENFNENRNSNEKQGLSDTRFLENGKYYYDINQDIKDKNSLFSGDRNNGYFTERQGMSDTRFLENGKYFHDINQEGVNEGRRNARFGNNNYENVNQNGKFEGKNGNFNTNNFEDENDNENENFEGKYGNFNNFENDDENEKFEGKYGNFNTNNFENDDENEKFEGKYGDFNTNNFENENHHENGRFEAGKQGMSDTRFLENGKYFYDAKNDNGVVGDVGFHHNNNVEYANTYSGNEYESGNNNYHGNEYHQVKEERDGYKPKKFPNEYDTMEEYDREQGYINGHEGEYVP